MYATLRNCSAKEKNPSSLQEGSLIAVTYVTTAAGRNVPTHRQCIIATDASSATQEKNTQEPILKAVLVGTNNQVCCLGVVFTGLNLFFQRLLKGWHMNCVIWDRNWFLFWGTFAKFTGRSIVA